MRPNLINRLKEEWNNLDPVDPLRGLIADAIDALAEQPAQQEPAFWMDTLDVERKTPVVISNLEKHEGAPAAEKCVYPVWTSPQPSKPWTELTDEDILRTKSQFKGTLDVQFDKFAYAIEAKLREKNA